MKRTETEGGRDKGKWRVKKGNGDRLPTFDLKVALVVSAVCIQSNTVSADIKVYTNSTVCCLLQSTESEGLTEHPVLTPCISVTLKQQTENIVIGKDRRSTWLRGQ